MTQLPLALIAALLTLAAVSAHAAPATQAQKIQRAFCPWNKKAAQPLIDPHLYHEGSIDDIGRHFETQARIYGACKKVVAGKGEGEFELHYEDAVFPHQFDWSARGRIVNFQSGEPEVRGDSFAKIRAFTERQLPGASLYIAREGETLLSVGGDTPLNVGGSSQVFLLRALKRKIDDKSLKPEQITRLSAKAKSVSFGFLHRWDDGTAFTLESLKNLAVIENDATAADLLLEVVGAAAVEKEGKHLTPFLSNRDHARLIGEKNAHPKTREEATKLLRALPDPGTKVEYPDERPALVKVHGWFATTKELCDAALGLREEPSPFRSLRSDGVRERIGNWADIAAFEGRGNGVMQTTWLLREKPGAPWHCLSLTLNETDPGKANYQAFSDLSGRIVSLISATSTTKSKRIE